MTMAKTPNGWQQRNKGQFVSGNKLLNETHVTYNEKATDR